MNACFLANSMWQIANARLYKAFQKALRKPLETQQQLLHHTLTRNASTAFGRQHAFNPKWTFTQFRRHVPLADYASLQSWIDRILRGEPNVLTADCVTHLIPTSGSTGPQKLVPYTRGLQRQFNAAIGPWVTHLFRSDPAIKGGPAYWSVSPAIATNHESAVPIGFDDDTAYLGRWARRLVNRTLAVPSSVRKIHDIDAFRLTTLRYLLAAKHLRLVSVWHPSFWTLLLDAMPQHWNQLLQSLESNRARELRSLEPSDTRRIWPDLRLISAWGDAAATLAFQNLHLRLPDIRMEAKGLIATECWTTVPFQDQYPLAIRSHVFEFLDDGGGSHHPHELDIGGTYEVVVTTAGGLYRYRTGDQVSVDGRLQNTPTMRFLGRASNISDICGEKLHEVFVAGALGRVCRKYGLNPALAYLSPSALVPPAHYVLTVAEENAIPTSFAQDIDSELQANPHYRYCRQLGQLGDISLTQLPANAAINDLLNLHAAGSALGNIKPRVLIANALGERPSHPQQPH